MSEGTRIEGSSPDAMAVSTLEEDAEKVKHSSAHPSAVGEKRQTDATAQAVDRETEQAQVEVAQSRKTYDGTTIKARNPTIVTMLIMQVVTDALKDSSDKTKEISKLEKRIWKHHSDGQSENFKQGESCQNYKNLSALSKMTLGIASSYAGERGIYNFKLLSEGNLKIASDVTGGFGDTFLQQKQMNIQIDEAKFQYKVGHTGSDYQNQSQQVSSDNQMVDSAREKGIQLGRLMVQLITAQPA